MAPRSRILALVIGALAAVAAVASAAELGVASEGLGAGAGPVAGCDADGADVSFEVVAAHDPSPPEGPPGPAVLVVAVSGIDVPACDGQWLEVSLVDGEGDEVGAAGPVQVTGPTATLPVRRAVPIGTCSPGADTCPGAPAQAIERVALVVVGGAPGG